MVCAEANKHGCIDTNHQDRYKFGANKCQYHSINFTKRRSVPKVIGLRVYEKRLIHVSHQVYMFIGSRPMSSVCHADPLLTYLKP